MTEPVVIWGAGAMGGTIGAYFARAGQNVLFVDIVPEHVQAINDRGIKITGPVAEFTAPARAILPGHINQKFSLVLLCVKAHHTEEATRLLAPRLRDDAVVVSVQNGLNETVIASIIGASRTFGCFVNFGADYIEPGVIHFGGRGTIAVGEIDGMITPRAREIHALFKMFDVRTALSSNVWGYLWSKLAYAAMLFATALSDESIADALARPEHRAIYTELAKEVVRVATVLRIRLEPFDGFDPAAFAADASAHDAEYSLDRLVAHNRTSAKTHSGIYRDLAVRKRKTEVDAQLGPVVEYGRRVKSPTPLNEHLIEMIHEIEAGSRGQSPANLDELALTLQEP